MKKISSALLILTFVLGACTTTSAPTETASTKATDPSATNSSIATEETTVAAREAVLSEIENTVSARKTSLDELISAEQGMSLLESGSVETGEDGRVRIDLMPEGTIVRVGPNSAFSFPKLNEEDGKPKTTITLLFGKVFILLNGGTLNVETPSGVASVRGSLLSVEYDPETNRMSAACMEGDCVLQGEEGEEIDIPEGQESFIDENELPMDPYPMDQDEVQDWLDENPDLELYMPDLPDPEDFPDWPADFDGNVEEYATEAYATEAFATEEATMEFVPDDSTNSTPPPEEPAGDTSDGGSGDPPPDP